jgi:putative transposase
MERGFVYLVAVIDVASRKVLSHEVATSLEAVHAQEVIEQAFRRFGVPQIVNTDEGSKFTAAEFTQAVLARGCQLSMDGWGAWRDNVVMERVWRTLKYEHVYKHIYANIQKAQQQVAKYLAWYKRARTRSSLDDQTPDEAYAKLQQSQERSERKAA